jgi:hypothetical protein
MIQRKISRVRSGPPLAPRWDSRTAPGKPDTRDARAAEAGAWQSVPVLIHFDHFATIHVRRQSFLFLVLSARKRNDESQLAPSVAAAALGKMRG